MTAPLRGPGFERLRELAEVVYEPWIDQVPLRIYDAQALAKRVADEDARLLVVESDVVAGPVLDQPLVAVAATRGEPTNVDVAAATAAGIPVLRTPGRNADAVAELTLGLLLAVTRRIVVADGEVRGGRVFSRGTIPYQRHRAWEVAGRSAALVGLGAVGRAVRWRLEALGMSVSAYDPYVPDAGHELEPVLEGSDVVSLHAPLSPETARMIGAEQFASMREGAVFLNTARAGLHDPDALVSALASGHLSGAGLDHFEGEVLPEGHPLLAMEQVVLTPHIGGATWETEARSAAMVAEDLSALLAGRRPANVVNPEVLAGG